MQPVLQSLSDPGRWRSDLLPNIERERNEVREEKKEGSIITNVNLTKDPGEYPATFSYDKRRRRDAVRSEEAKAKTAVIDSNVNFIFEPVEMEFYGSIKQMWESLQSRTLKIMKGTGQHTSRIVAKKHCHTPSV